MTQNQPGKPKVEPMPKWLAELRALALAIVVGLLAVGFVYLTDNSSPTKPDCQTTNAGLSQLGLSVDDFCAGGDGIIRQP